MATPPSTPPTAQGVPPAPPEAHQRASRTTGSIEDQQEELILDVIHIEKLTPAYAQEMRFDGLYKSPTQTFLVVTDEEDRQRVVVNEERRPLGFALQDLAHFLRDLGVDEFELHLKWGTV